MSDLVPLRSGEAVAVRDAATDQLADALDFLKQRAREARELQDVISRELVERLRHENRRSATVGDWTVTAQSGRTREWDASELEGVLEDLVARGVISASAATGVIRREVKVSGQDALRLAGSLDGGDREQVERCASWKSGKPSVRVERAS